MVPDRLVAGRSVSSGSQGVAVASREAMQLAQISKQANPQGQEMGQENPHRSQPIPADLDLAKTA